MHALFRSEVQSILRVVRSFGQSDLTNLFSSQTGSARSREKWPGTRCY